MRDDPFERIEELLRPVCEEAAAHLGGRAARRLVSVACILVKEVLPKVFSDPNLEHGWDEVGPFVDSVVSSTAAWAVGGRECLEDMEALCGQPLQEFRAVYEGMSDIERKAGKMVEYTLFAALSFEPNWPQIAQSLGWDPQAISAEASCACIVEMACETAADLLAEVDKDAPEDGHEERIAFVVGNLLRVL